MECLEIGGILDWRGLRVISVGGSMVEYFAVIEGMGIGSVGRVLIVVGMVGSGGARLRVVEG